MTSTVNSSKIALVTGGNAGIGYQTALGIARAGYRTVILGRSLEKLQAAQELLRKEAENAQIDILVCDLSSQQQIRKAAAEFQERYPRLDLLVNNAGAFLSERKMTAEGIESQWAINHLGPFLLTNLLLDLIKKNAPARIVTVSSNAHYNGKIHFDDLNMEKRSYSAFKQYSSTKLANVLFSNELARRLEGSGVSTYSLHPGVVKTNIAQKDSNWFFSSVWTVMKLFMMSPERGAKTSLHCALSPKTAGVSGQYYDSSREKQPAPLAQDASLAKKLWEVSATAVGL